MFSNDQIFLEKQKELLKLFDIKPLQRKSDSPSTAIFFVY